MLIIISWRGCCDIRNGICKITEAALPGGFFVCLKYGLGLCRAAEGGVFSFLGGGGGSFFCSVFGAKTVSLRHKSAFAQELAHKIFADQGNFMISYMSHFLLNHNPHRFPETKPDRDPSSHIAKQVTSNN